MSYLRLQDGQAVTLEITSEPETNRTWWKDGTPHHEPVDGVRVRVTHVVEVDDVRAEQGNLLDVDHWEMSNTVKKNVQQIARRKNSGAFAGLRLYVEREGVGLATTYHIEYLGANSTAMPAAQAAAAALVQAAGVSDQAIVGPPQPLPPEIALPPSPEPTPEQLARIVSDNLAKAYAFTAQERGAARDYIAAQLASGFDIKSICVALLQSFRSHATLDSALCNGEVKQ